MSEPTPWRDPGPYETAEQAREQVDATMHGIPLAHTAPGFAGEMILMEAQSLAGVRVSAFEDITRNAISRALTESEIQVIAGWIIRAHMTGARKAEVYPPRNSQN